MKRSFPAINRMIQDVQIQRSNDILLNKISHLKFTNFTSLKNKKSPTSLLKVRNVSFNCQPSQIKPLRAKTVMSNRTVQRENSRKDFQYSKIEKKKSFAIKNRQRQEIHYPFNRNHAVAQIQGIESTFNSISVAIKSQIKSIQRLKTFHVFEKISEQQRKQRIILLWNQGIQLQKIWHAIKFLRFKEHYQIQVVPSSLQKNFYTVKLSEQLGTNLLTQNDYDYEYISTNFIKFSHHAMYITFELQNGPQKIKNYLKFQKNVINEEDYNQAFSIIEAKKTIEHQSIRIMTNQTRIPVILQQVKQQAHTKQIS